MTLFPGDGLLHLVHDQHQVSPGLIHNSRKGFREGGASRLAQGPQIEFKLADVEIHVHTLEPGQQRGGRRLQVGKGPTYGLFDQRAGIGRRVTPQVHVNHDRSLALQLRDQVVAEEGGFAGAAQTGEKEARAPILVQRIRMEKPLRHGCCQL